jgi:hypothetical protein
LGKRWISRSPCDSVSILLSSRHGQGRQLIRNGFDPHGSPLHLNRNRPVPELLVGHGDLGVKSPDSTTTPSRRAAAEPVTT